MPLAWLTRRRRPAVSTKRQSWPSISTSESTGSTVVPATSWTTDRDSPVSLFSSDDLPTFGRPISATRRGPPPAPTNSAGAVGSASSTASSRSPEPRPCSADTAIGSPRPSDHSAAASASARSSSTLLTARITGRFDRRSTRAIASSVSVAPTVASTTTSTASLICIARSACAVTAACSPLAVGSQPTGVHHGEPAAPPQRVVRHPVPGHPGHVLDDRLPPPDQPVDQRGLADVGPADHGQRRRRSVVTRHRPSPSASSSQPVNSLSSLQVPSAVHRRRRRLSSLIRALRGPRMPGHLARSRACMSDVRPASLPHAARAPSRAPVRVQFLHQRGQIHPDRLGRLGDRSAATADRHRERLPHQRGHHRPEPPARTRPGAPCRGSRPAPRRPGPGREPAGSGEHGVDVAGAPGALREDADRPAGLELGQRLQQRLPIRGAADDRVLPDVGEQPAQRALHRLRLHQEGHPPGQAAEQHRPVHQVLVVGHDDDRAGRRDPLDVAQPDPIASAG